MRSARVAPAPAVAVFSLALALRLLVFAYVAHDPEKFYAADSRGYEIRARGLLEHGVFTAREEPPFTPDLIRTPVYPAFMAGVFALTGHAPAAVILLQILLGGLTALLTFRLAAWLGLSLRAATGAALIVALDPVAIMTANLLLSETLFTLLLVLGLGLLARHWQTAQARWLLGSALVLALATLTRPISQFLPPALLPLFGVAEKRTPLGAVARVGIPFVLLTTLLTAPWAYRNYREAGVVTLSSAGSGVLFSYWAPTVLAQAEGIGVDAARHRLRTEFRRQADQLHLTGSERGALARRQAVAVLTRYPGFTLAMLAKGLGRLLFDPGYTVACTLLDPQSHATECFPGRATMSEPGLLEKALGRFVTMNPVQQLTLVWSTLLLGLIYTGAAAGVAAFARDRRWLTLAFLAIVVGYLVAVSTGAQAESRFRIPILPFLAICSGAGLERLAGRRQRSGTPA